MAGVFESIFGTPTALIERREAEQGANRRAGIAAGTAAAQLAEQRRQFDVQQSYIQEAQDRWQQIMGQLNVVQPAGPVSLGPGLIPGMDQPPLGPNAGPVITAPPGTATNQASVMAPPRVDQQALQLALHQFVTSPEFIGLGAHASGQQMAKLVRDLIASPTSIEPFTLSPGQNRYIPGAGPNGGMGVVEGPPSPRSADVAAATARGTRGVSVLEDALNSGRTSAKLGGDLNDLLTLSRAWGEGGVGANAQQWAATRLGLDIGGGSTAQQFTAIVSRIVNQMPRSPGAQSDFEARNLLASLPTLASTPTARENVIRRLMEIARDSQRRGEVAGEFFAGRISMDEAFNRTNAIDAETAEALRSLRERLSGSSVQIAPNVTIRPVGGKRGR